MANLKLTILKDKPAKDGPYKIRVAPSPNGGIKYILTRFVVDNAIQYNDGLVIRRADAADMNRKLRTLLNDYSDILDSIKGIAQYSCKELRDLIISRLSIKNSGTFQNVGSYYVGNGV